MKPFFRNKTFVVLYLVILNFVSCNKNTSNITYSEVPVDTQVNLTPYTITYPTYFTKMDIPSDNQPFVERIELGKKLYYDNILSNDGRSCASCHLQSYGFTVPHTVSGTSVLPHVNLGWYNTFMWDGSKRGTLEDVMLFETEEFFATDLEKINASKTYKELFKQCYNVDYITHKDIGYALAQFTRIMVSGDNKYDRYLKGQAVLTFNEEKGRQIFFSEKGDCFHCHVNVLTTDNALHNTGLDSVYTKQTDRGYYNITGDAKDLGKFKTPNLRNVALRKNFMHDGRFTSLEEVVDFYDHGVKHVSNIDPVMTKNEKIFGLKLTELEKMQLVAFLKTFTDSTFINDKQFNIK
ncbi:MAG: hypothetical protein KDC07_04960 [Chitinophagaceae bacterium]|nr:hypothetical protein [Chitinophagaceae bacterium]